MSESKYKPQMKYDAANTVKITLKLNKNTDADILSFLATTENKQGTIKNLIRKELKSQGE